MVKMKALKTFNLGLKRINRGETFDCLDEVAVTLEIPPAVAARIQNAPVKKTAKQPDSEVN